MALENYDNYDWLNLRDDRHNNTEPSTAETDTSIARLISTLLISAGVGAVLGLLFLAMQYWFPKFYLPRKQRFIKAIWLWRMLATTDNGLITSRGPDAIVYLRVMRLCLYLSGLSLLSFAVVMPINKLGTNEHLPLHDASRTEGLNVLTTANIDSESGLFWVHLTLVYVFSIAIWIALHFMTVRYLKDKEKWLSRCTPAEYTVMFQTLRDDLKTEERLRQWLEKWYPAKVVACHLVRKCPQLKEDRENYKEYSEALASAQHVYETKGTRPTARVNGYCKNLIGGEKVDALDYFSAMKAAAEERINAAIAASPESYEPSGAALVTFDNTFIARAMHHPTYASEINCMTADPAPEQADVVWDDAGVSTSSRLLRACAVCVLLFVLVFFWGIPVAVVASATQLDNISRLPGGEWLVDLIDLTKVARGLLEGFIPSLALVILAEIPIHLIKFLVSQIGLRSYSKQEKWVFSTYYYFLMANVLLVAALSGGVLGVLDDMIDHPGSIADRLAQTMPKQSTYFICFVIIKGGALPLELLRLFDWIVYMVKLHLIAKTAQQKSRLHKPEPYYYASKGASRVFVFSIMLVYSLMAPLVVPFTFIYFLIAYFMEKHNIIYVYKKKWEGGGFIWEAVMHQMFVALMIFQITMIGIFGINRFIPGAAVIPLPFVTIIMWYITYRLSRAANIGPIEDERYKKSITAATAFTKYQDIDSMDGRPVGELPPREKDEDDAHDISTEEEERRSLLVQENDSDENLEDHDEEEGDEEKGHKKRTKRPRWRKRERDAEGHLLDDEALWVRKMSNAYVQPELRPLFKPRVYV